MNKLVLVADDNRLARAAHKHCLRRAGFEVIEAGDGEEALEVARQQLPGVIVLDLLMPKIGGVDVLNELKRDADTTHIPVIILSAMSQMNEHKLTELGAAAYCEKSTIEPKHLPDFIWRVLRNVTTQ
jgi:CheY-like chemotaxis protein